MKLGRKENELLFVFSMITFIVYSGYALLQLITMSYVPILTSLVLLSSLLITIFLIINYELNFDDIEVETKEQIEKTIEIDSSLVNIG